MTGKTRLMDIVVIDYGSGNLRSAAKAIEAAADNARGDFSVTVTGDADRVARADRIVLPGQGAFGDCMAGLGDIGGMVEALNESVCQRAVPFFGICVGMQLMARSGIEHGDHAGLGWFSGRVERLDPDDAALKIPHMGWNDLEFGDAPHPVLQNIGNRPHAYFVHSYAYRPEAESSGGEVLATVDYGGTVTAAIGRDNMIGTQFHPDKSQATGIRILQNFLDWRP